MIRDVDLVSYLPPFLQEYKETIAALEAENPEFILAWSAQDQILYNCFIETADSYGLSRYEKLLGIYPTADDNLESRRSRVRARWVLLMPYTWNALLEKLNALCGNNDYIVSGNFSVGYTLTLITYLESYGAIDELHALLQEILPCNIVVESTNQIRVTAYGVPNFGARLTTHARIILTNDFNETYKPLSNAKAASAVGYCDVFEIKS